MAKPVTLKDIATEAGVGVITASRAIRGIGRVNSQTRKRILETAERLGYNRSRGVFIGAPAKLGSDEHKLNLVLPAFMGDMERISGPFGEGIMNGLRERMTIAGGELHIIPVSKPEDITAHWPRKKVHGVILRHTLPAQWIDMLKSYAPVVYSVAHDAHLGIDSINYDEHKSATTMLNHLVAAGHKTILCFGFVYHRKDTHLPEELFNLSDPRDLQARIFYGRRLGAWSAAQETLRGLADIHLRIFRSPSENADFTILMRKAFDALEGMKNRPTAVVLLTGPSSLFFAEAAARGIRIPDDLSVLTYQSEKGDMYVGKDVSGIRLPTVEVGRAIPEIIERRLAMPEAIAVALNFECAWHEGNTIGKSRQ